MTRVLPATLLVLVAGPVCDRDGTNAKTILRPQVKSAGDDLDTQFGWIDWR